MRARLATMGAKTGAQKLQKGIPKREPKGVPERAKTGPQIRPGRVGKMARKRLQGSVFGHSAAPGRAGRENPEKFFRRRSKMEYKNFPIPRRTQIRILRRRFFPDFWISGKNIFAG